jgi:hypothetical protein
MVANVSLERLSLIFGNLDGGGGADRLYGEVGGVKWATGTSS